jgi:hypothetical protein
VHGDELARSDRVDEAEAAALQAHDLGRRRAEVEAAA